MVFEMSFRLTFILFYIFFFINGGVMVVVFFFFLGMQKEEGIAYLWNELLFGIDFLIAFSF